MDIRSLVGTYNTKPLRSAAIAQGSTPGTDVIVTGVAGKHIYVYAYKFTMHAAGSFKWQSKPSGAATDLEGAQTYDANGGAAEQDQRYLFRTNATGDSLQITTATGAANGRVSYWIE